MAPRRDAEAAQREEVAAEMRRLVATAGLTRAEFAREVGTPASRLSTYFTGRVVAAATLVVRMRHVAARSTAATPDYKIMNSRRT
jgi:hypothetical protein